MKKVIRLLIFMITLFLSVNKTLAYYDISDYFTNVFNSKDKYKTKFASFFIFNCGLFWHFLWAGGNFTSTTTFM